MASRRKATSRPARKPRTSPTRGPAGLREQLAATARILRALATAPGDLQAVLDAVAEQSARVCGATDSLIHRIDSDRLLVIAHHGPIRTSIEPGGGLPLTRDSASGLAALERRTIHVPDLEAAAVEYPTSVRLSRQSGFRTMLAVPMVGEERVLGVITIRRSDARPFTAGQIAALESFADQAAIAIGHARLFQEVTEALERERATGGILRVIASSPTTVEPVFDAILDSAMRLCASDTGLLWLHDGEAFRLVADRGAPRQFVDPRRGPHRPGPHTGPARAVTERRPVQIVDLLADHAYAQRDPGRLQTIEQLGARTGLWVPMLRDGAPIGVIGIWRREVQAFTESQIQLLSTFADQAVIALENVRLFQELGARNRELTEALEQQTATAEILRVISGSPTDLQPVMDTVAESAARVCGATDAHIFRLDGDVLRLVTRHGALPGTLGIGDPVSATRDSVTGRAVAERRTLHVQDIQALPETEFPETRARQRRLGYTGGRTFLVTPLLREGEPVGAILIRRGEARPFSPRQIELLETFAAQAVIAIENVRLFQELRARNSELTEALEQQTATAEILRAISSSPTDIEPVLDTILRNGLRLCEAQFGAIFRFDGEAFRLAVATEIAAEFRAYLEGARIRPGRETPLRRVALEKRPVQIADVLADPDCAPPEAYRREGMRTALSVPMLKEGELVGALTFHRHEVRLFSDGQIALLETFADQAVIAIENVRLFQELQARNRELTESLEQQTATAEILRVISSSPTDLQPVLDAVAESAARLCGATDAMIRRIDGDVLRFAAHYGTLGQAREDIGVDRGSVLGRAVVDRQTVHVHDLAAAREAEFPASRIFQQRYGYRTVLATPLLREGVPLGGILIRRTEVRPFTDKQIRLLETFADQAAIAVENVRLFQELEARNRELTEALEQQMATGEILRVISRSQTDVQPVFDAIVRSAVRLCDGAFGTLLRFDGELAQPVAWHNVTEEALEAARRIFPVAPTRRFAATRAIVDRAVIHIPDIENDPELDRSVTRAVGSRGLLVVPMLREGSPIGSISVGRATSGPFSAKQIELLQTFAAQAVIAIENVRLFKELEARNRDLTEALEQQTATSEILQVISRSPTDLQPVMDALAESAARLCGADNVVVFRQHGDALEPVAVHGPTPAMRLPVSRGVPSGRAVLDRQTVHVADLSRELEGEFPDARERWERYEALRHHAILATPLLREDQAIGTITIRRHEPGPFSDKQVDLLQTFAAQAVIAIENVRLFNELQARTEQLTRSVDKLTALGEVSGAVSATLDLETVLNTIVSRAAHLAGADGAAILEYDEATREFRIRATHNYDPELVESIRAMPIKLGEGLTGLAAERREPMQVSDIAPEGAYRSHLRDILLRMGYRALLSVPLVREDQVIGGLVVTRRAPGEFAPEVVELLKTFGTQSALAIQNARLFREVEEQGRQLAIASRHKSQFLANMSHELRTPLNAVLGYTELILDNIFGDVPEPIRDSLERSRASGQHLLGLINDVLDLSKIEAGQLTLSLADYAMEEVVHAVVTAVESLAAEKKLALRVTVPPDLPPGRGDSRRLTQVLLNLAGNAVKFTDAGEVRVAVSVADGAFVVSVADTGPGISEADQAKIFEEFQQADSSMTRKKGGTGLGLAIAKRIVELHGGRISVESRVGAGSTFRFSVPVRA